MRLVMAVSKASKPRLTDVYRAIIDTNTPLVLNPDNNNFLICCAYSNIYQLGNGRFLYENRPKKMRICVVSTNFNVLKHQFKPLFTLIEENFEAHIDYVNSFKQLDYSSNLLMLPIDCCQDLNDIDTDFLLNYVRRGGSMLLFPNIGKAGSWMGLSMAETQKAASNEVPTSKGFYLGQIS